MSGLPPRRPTAWPSFWPGGVASLAKTGAARGLAALVVSMFVAACSPYNAALALPKAGGPIPVGKSHTPTAAERAYWDQLLPARVIYIGETHNNDADHEYQFDVLKGLKVRGAEMAIAWEMFDSTQQETLDGWWSHHLTTDQLLEKTDFQRRWGKYSVFYEKILRWSLSEGVPSVALNAPESISHKLADGQPLDDAERAMIPVGYHPLPGGYEHFAEQMGSNPHAGANLANFYKAQLLWDQTMATRIVDYLAAHPNGKLVVLIGRGHVDGGYGVPAFVSQKTDAPQLLVYPGGAPEHTHSGGSVARADRHPTAIPL